MVAYWRRMATQIWVNIDSDNGFLQPSVINQGHKREVFSFQCSHSVWYERHCFHIAGKRYGKESSLYFVLYEENPLVTSERCTPAVQFPVMTLFSSLLVQHHITVLFQRFPDSKVHGANMGPTWVLSAPADGPHVGPMNLAIRVDMMN